MFRDALHDVIPQAVKTIYPGAQGRETTKFDNFLRRLDFDVVVEAWRRQRSPSTFDAFEQSRNDGFESPFTELRGRLCGDKSYTRASRRFSPGVSNLHDTPKDDLDEYNYLLQSGIPVIFTRELEFRYCSSILAIDLGVTISRSGIEADYDDDTTTVRVTCSWVITFGHDDGSERVFVKS